MRIQLTNPPWQRDGFYGVRGGSRWPHFEEEHSEYMPFPFLLAYSAALLEQHGFEIDCIDALAEKLTLDRFLNRVANFGADVLVLEVSSISIEDDLRTVAAIREQGYSGKLVLCGLHEPMYHVGFLSAHSLIDAVLIGEFEQALLDLVTAWTSRTTCSGFDRPMPGVVFRRKDGKVLTGGRRGLADVDHLPWPARHRFNMALYHDEPGSIPRPSVQMWASRGCPYGCVFCAWPQILYGGREFRPRAPKAVADEFEAMVRTWGFQSVYFDDDTFNVKRENVLALCQELTRRNVSVPWAAMCRPDLMDRAVLEALISTGFEAVKYGVESGDSGILKRSGKGLDLEKAIRNILLTKEMGVKTHLTFMFGLPGETLESAKKTTDLALQLAPESLQFTIATPFPGSRYQRILEEKGLLVYDNLEKHDGFRTAAVHSGHLSPEQIEEVVREANNRWRGTWIQRRKVEGSYPVEVSIVIPNYHRREALSVCLEALSNQTFDKFEVVLVDNGSRDDSVLAARQIMPEITVIQRDHPIGFAAAVNLGIRGSRGRYVAVLNNDTEPDPTWLEEVVRVLNDRPETGFVASRVLSMDDSERMDSLGDGLTLGCYPFQSLNGAPAKAHNSKITEVFGAPATAAVYRRTMLEDLGGFDEDFETYLEDLDLSLRAQLRGWTCLANPMAVVRHRAHHTTGGVDNPEVVRLLGRNWIQLLLKSVPRRVLTEQSLKILHTAVRQGVFHTFRSRHPLAYFRGLVEGFARTPSLLKKRKAVLGWRQVGDDRILELLATGSELLACTRKLRSKAVDS